MNLMTSDISSIVNIERNGYLGVGAEVEAGVEAAAEKESRVIVVVTIEVGGIGFGIIVKVEANRDRYPHVVRIILKIGVHHGVGINGNLVEVVIIVMATGEIITEDGIVVIIAVMRRVKIIVAVNLLQGTEMGRIQIILEEERAEDTIEEGIRVRG